MSSKTAETETSIEAEMQRRRDSDYRPLSDSQKINILHEVIIKLDEKVDCMKAEIETMHQIITGEPRR